MDNLTPDLLSRIETLESRLRVLEAMHSPVAVMTPTPAESTEGEGASRRDLLRYGAVALGAAAAAGMNASPAAAANGGPVIKAAGDGEGTFSWRVVAKRRDIAAPRFERMVIPTEPALPWPSGREGDDGKGSQNAER